MRIYKTDLSSQLYGCKIKWRTTETLITAKVILRNSVRYEYYALERYSDDNDNNNMVLYQYQIFVCQNTVNTNNVSLVQSLKNA